DRRPASVGAALARARASVRPAARDASPVLAEDAESAREGALVKSVRKLLWVLWGLSWVIVPPGLHELGHQRLVPLVLFGALAGLLVLTWHEGALLRAA